jgi:hypothetical protein
MKEFETWENELEKFTPEKFSIKKLIEPDPNALPPLSETEKAKIGAGGVALAVACVVVVFILLGMGL